MSNIKDDTHIVLKREDIYKYLSENEMNTLFLLLEIIERKRINDGKKLNKYYICNIDEPYAKEVLDVILKNEYEKL